MNPRTPPVVEALGFTQFNMFDLHKQEQSEVVPDVDPVPARTASGERVLIDCLEPASFSHDKPFAQAEAPDREA